MIPSSLVWLIAGHYVYQLVVAPRFQITFVSLSTSPDLENNDIFCAPIIQRRLLLENSRAVVELQFFNNAYNSQQQHHPSISFICSR